MGYTWSDVWTIRGRSSSIFPRCATRPQGGPYEVLGACRLVDFHVAAVVDSFPVFWVLPLGLFLVASASWDLSFLLGLLLVFSASWGLSFLLDLFLVLCSS